MTIYILASKKVVLIKKEIRMKDVAKVYCADSRMKELVEELVLGKFSDHLKQQKVLHLYDDVFEFLKKHTDFDVEFVEEHDILVEYQNPQKANAWDYIKIGFVCLLCFFGAAFTIMAFHNDIGILKLFEHVYELFLGSSEEHHMLLEIPYSIGLSAGIILFFNHLGGKRITKDPTPVEVAMSSYEDGVNRTILEEEKQVESTKQLRQQLKCRGGK